MYNTNITQLFIAITHVVSAVVCVGTYGQFGRIPSNIMKQHFE